MFFFTRLNNFFMRFLCLPAGGFDWSQCHLWELTLPHITLVLLGDQLCSLESSGFTYLLYLSVREKHSAISVLGLCGLTSTLITQVSVFLGGGGWRGERVIMGKEGARFGVVCQLAFISRESGWAGIKSGGQGRVVFGPNNTSVRLLPESQVLGFRQLLFPLVVTG